MGFMSLKRIFELVSYGSLTLAILALLLLGGGRLYTQLYAHPRLYSVEQAPTRRVAIVFGAEVRPDGVPSTVLRDRVEAAAQLYFAGKVEKLLMSGDNRFEDYDEPSAMRKYAIQLGVPEEAIVRDYAGRRTYDTCYRAKEIFGVQEAILVTQAFHLPRALYICNTLGVSAVGVRADLYTYRRRLMAYWHLREAAATLMAFWEVNITHPLPVLGQPEPIFPLETQ